MKVVYVVSYVMEGRSGLDCIWFSNEKEREEFMVENWGDEWEEELEENEDYVFNNIEV